MSEHSWLSAPADPQARHALLGDLQIDASELVSAMLLGHSSRSSHAPEVALASSRRVQRHGLLRRPFGLLATSVAAAALLSAVFVGTSDHPEPVLAPIDTLALSRATEPKIEATVPPTTDTITPAAPEAPIARTGIRTAAAGDLLDLAPAPAPAAPALVPEPDPGPAPDAAPTPVETPSAAVMPSVKPAPSDEYKAPAPPPAASGDQPASPPRVHDAKPEAPRRAVRAASAPEEVEAKSDGRKTRQLRPAQKRQRAIEEASVAATRAKPEPTRLAARRPAAEDAAETTGSTARRQTSEAGAAPPPFTLPDVLRPSGL